MRRQGCTTSRELSIPRNRLPSKSPIREPTHVPNIPTALSSCQRWPTHGEANKLIDVSERFSILQNTRNRGSLTLHAKKSNFQHAQPGHVPFHFSPVRYSPEALGQAINFLSIPTWMLSSIQHIISGLQQRAQPGVIFLRPTFDNRRVVELKNEAGITPKLLITLWRFAYRREPKCTGNLCGEFINVTIQNAICETFVGNKFRPNGSGCII